METNINFRSDVCVRPGLVKLRLATGFHVALPWPCRDQVINSMLWRQEENIQTWRARTTINVVLPSH